MIVNASSSPFPFISVEDFLTEKELSLVMLEARGLWDANVLSDDLAATQNNELLKTGTGVFLDNIYSNRSCSRIITFTEKIFEINDIWQASIDEGDWYLARTMARSNKHATLLNYYQAGQEYKSHVDNSRITAVLTLTDPEIEVKGGEFVFPDHNITIPLKNNQIIIFPSVIPHAAKPVIAEAQGRPSRYSVVLFIDRV